MNADNVITYWACSARCWQEGGPHGDDCRPTNYVRLDEGEWVGTDADRAVLDAAEELIEADKFGGPGEYGHALMALTRAVDALVAARREAQ